ncbi:MAG: methyl-accepting chemotaxis protein, partial [Lachnospiraceae bacterium]|nr:methyl-accepting chemotaxis protein [Lachnospiraceae bacterium]
QYGKDADLFGELASWISDMTDNIKASMNEVNDAIQSIAENTQDTANHSAEITDSVDTVSHAVESVADLAIKQQETAGNLQEIVSHFRLN